MKKKGILIIEDDANNLELERYLLNMAGFKVWEAVDFINAFSTFWFELN